MTRNTVAAALLVALVGCSDAPLDPAAERDLAASLSQEGSQVMEAQQATPGGWIARVVRAVRNNGDSTALQQLDDARVLRDQARAAHEAGDDEAARALMEQAKTLLFTAIVRTFPNAPTRTGDAVDAAVDRITERLGDREAPRIRRVLSEVAQLRVDADVALADGDAVGALALNFQAARMLQRMIHFLQARRSDAPRELGEHVRQMDF